jgi:hypothetical protein
LEHVHPHKLAAAICGALVFTGSIFEQTNRADAILGHKPEMLTSAAPQGPEFFRRAQGNRFYDKLFTLNSRF